MFGRQSIMMVCLAAAICSGCGTVGNQPGNATGFAGGVSPGNVQGFRENVTREQARRSDRGVADLAKNIHTQSYRLDSSTHTLHVQLGFGVDAATRAGSQLRQPQSGGFRNNVLSFTVPRGWTIQVTGPAVANASLAVVPLQPVAPHAGATREVSPATGAPLTAIYHAMAPGDYGLMLHSSDGSDHLIDVVTVSDHTKKPSVGETNPFHRTTP